MSNGNYGMEARFSAEAGPTGDKIALSNLSESPSSSAVGGKSGRGVWLTAKTIALILIVSALILVGVILAVYFGHPDRSKANVEQPSSTTTATASPPVETTEGTGLPTDVRLPLHLIPTDYVLKLRPDIYQESPSDFSFNGSVEIYVNATSTINVATVHYRKLDIDTDEISVVAVDHPSQNTLNIKQTWTDSSREFFHLEVEPSFEAGYRYRISFMDFSGPITGDLRGIYYSSYQMNNETRYLLASQLQPTDARKTFPCLDEPALKAKFTISIERKRHYQTMGNTQIKETQSLERDWVRDVYIPTPPMSTYILAFIVSDFECKSNKTSNDKLVEVCARPNAIDQVDFALSIAVPMQEFFEGYHNISYPLGRAIHVAVPDFAAGAMENWGLIIYRETALLFSEADSSAANKQRVAVVVAHELAHMWFGNLVTPAWWDDIWLNEGFASYMEYTCLSDQFPDWRMEDQFVIDDLHSVFAPDSLATSHPIYQQVQHPAQIAEIFDSITYNKGAAVIRMMKYFLGEEVFRIGISNYLKARAYEAAHHSDLFRALTEEARLDGQDVNVTEIMATWILQMGYPVIDVEYAPGSGTANFTQKHFLRVKDSQIIPAPFNYKWNIPVTLIAENNVNWEEPDVTWFDMSTKSASVTLNADADWVLGNVRQRFYYRVNYKESMWESLINTLNTNHTMIHIKNRAQIMDDSLNLARAGELGDALDALKVTEYLDVEEGYIPWAAARRTFRFLKNRLIKNGATGTYLNSYIVKKVKNIYASLGWATDITGDSEHVNHLHRSVVLDLACSSGSSDCQKKALELWNAWKNASANGQQNPISQNIREVVYCTALGSDASDDWEWAFERFREANVAAEQRRLMESLACTQNSQKLAKFLQLAIEEEVIRRGDFRTVIQSVSANPVGKHIAWNFFKANWDTMIERFGEASFTLSRIVEYLTSTFSEDWEISQLMTFMENNPDQGSARLAFQQALENANNNMEWRKNNEDAYAEWLEMQSVNYRE